MQTTKIVPNLWFHSEGGSISPLLSYYNTVFQDDFKAGSIIPLGETPSGLTEMCEVVLFGQKYVFMSTALVHHPLNDAVSFMIHCENQQEIDTIWDYFTQNGQESQCGWCIDKYGLRWQIIPKNLGELMRKPNAFTVLMGQKKIVIDEF